MIERVQDLKLIDNPVFHLPGLHSLQLLSNPLVHGFAGEFRLSTFKADESDGGESAGADDFDDFVGGEDVDLGFENEALCGLEGV